MRTGLFVLTTASVLLFSSCSEKKSEEPTVSGDTTQAQQSIRITPAEHGVDYPKATLQIVSPREGQVLENASDSVFVVLNVSGMEIAKPTPGDTNIGLNYSKEGQHVHVIVDDKPYMANYKNGQPFNVGVLSPGMHVIRAFPSRSWHESVKVPAAFATRTFYVASKTGDAAPFDPKAPLLTYSRPKGTYAGDKRVLLDFFVSNVKLGEQDHKVSVTIDGQAVDTLTEWRPYIIEGLVKGEHTISLSLLDAKGQPVPGRFNQPTGKITIE